MLRTLMKWCSQYGHYLIVALFMQATVAAPQLADTAAADATPVDVPGPSDLDANWWKYLGDAPDSELDARRQAVVDKATSQVLALTVADAADLNLSLTRLESQLGAYARARMAAEPAPAPALRVEGQFTPEQILAIVAERDAVSERIRTSQDDQTDRERLLARDRNRLAEVFADYASLAEGSVQRIRLGLQVMALRSSTALTRIQIDRISAQLQVSRAFRQALDAQLVHAQQNLTLEGLDADQLAQLLENHRAAKLQATQTLERLREQLLGMAEEGDEAAMLARDGIRQEAVGAAISELAARVEAAVVSVQLAWLRLRGETAQGAELDETLLAEWTALEEAVRVESEPWLAAASDVLLSPQLADRGRDSARRRGLEQLREQAQANLRDARDLGVRGQQLALLRQMLEQEYYSQLSTPSRWLVKTRSFFLSLWRGTGNLLDAPLFDIGDAPVTAAGILRIIIILLIAYWISRAIRHALDRLTDRNTLMTGSSVYTLGRLVHYLIMITALLVGLGSIGLDFSSLALIAGALSVGIGFGLQSIVSNFVSGLILLFERSLKVGDYVELDNGLTGHVKAINIRSTRINTNDNIDVLVPNSEFVGSRLINWTLYESMARMRIRFGVAYGTDKDLVRKAALEAADRVEFTLKNMPGKEPEVWLVNYGDSSLDFDLLIWVSRHGVRRPSRVRAYCLWELHTSLEEYGIEIPFPQRDLHLRSGMTPAAEAVTEPSE